MGDFDYLDKKFDKPIHIERLGNEGCPFKPGQKLPNGAIILASKDLRRYEHRIELLVFCITSGFTPFVTWIRLITTDSPAASSKRCIVDTCSWGHYHRTLDEGLEDFKSRAANYVTYSTKING